MNLGKKVREGYIEKPREFPRKIPVKFPKKPEKAAY